MGILASLDSFMNIVLESVEEKNNEGEVINKYSHIFLRGNNGNLELNIVLYISAKTQ